MTRRRRAAQNRPPDSRHLRLGPLCPPPPSQGLGDLTPSKKRDRAATAGAPTGSVGLGQVSGPPWPRDSACGKSKKVRSTAGAWRAGGRGVLIRSGPQMQGDSPASQVAPGTPALRACLILSFRTDQECFWPQSYFEATNSSIMFSGCNCIQFTCLETFMKSAVHAAI